MSNQPCTCCGHIPATDGKRINFYRENFIPEGCRLYYTEMTGRKYLYMTGRCKRCFGLLEEPIPLEDGLSGDAELQSIYDAVQGAHPYDEKNERIGYYGPLEERTAYYSWRDRQPLFRRNQKFLDLFHDYDRAQVRQWLERKFLPQTHEEVYRDTGGNLFSTAVRLARENGDFANVDPILDYILPRADESHIQERVHLTDYGFDFIALVNFGGSEGVYLDCYLWGKFDESGRRSLHIGTLKTLSRSLEAVKAMGELGGALMYHAHRYVDQQIHRYTPDDELMREAEHKKAKESKSGS